MTHGFTVAQPFASVNRQIKPPSGDKPKTRRTPVAEVHIAWPGYNPTDAIRLGGVTPITSVTYSHRLAELGAPIITAESDAFGRPAPLTAGDLYWWLSEHGLEVISYTLIGQERAGRWMGTYRLIIGRAQ